MNNWFVWGQDRVTDIIRSLERIAEALDALTRRKSEEIGSWLLRHEHGSLRVRIHQTRVVSQFAKSHSHGRAMTVPFESYNVFVVLSQSPSLLSVL
jgi:hypothetical protein